MAEPTWRESLERELAKLDPAEEVALAEEWLGGEREVWRAVAVPMAAGCGQRPWDVGGCS